MYFLGFVPVPLPFRPSMIEYRQRVYLRFECYGKMTNGFLQVPLFFESFFRSPSSANVSNFLATYGCFSSIKTTMLKCSLANFCFQISPNQMVLCYHVTVVFPLRTQTRWQNWNKDGVVCSKSRTEPHRPGNFLQLCTRTVTELSLPNHQRLLSSSQVKKNSRIL